MTKRVGRLYVFEGPDGVGKTTLAEEFVRETLDGEARYYAFPGKVPGTIGAHIYDLHHNYQKYGIDNIHTETLQLLHIVAHIDAIRYTLLPSLEEGKTIVLDRWWLSTLVYGLQSGIHIVHLSDIIGLEKKMWGNYLTPDAVFLIDRDEPIDREVDMADWCDLRDRYRGLAYSGLYSSFNDVTTIIPNNHGIADALQSIGEYVMNSSILG